MKNQLNPYVAQAYGEAMFLKATDQERARILAYQETFIEAQTQARIVQEDFEQIKRNATKALS